MATPFIGEIKMMACNFAPKNYATCDGQLLPISQNTALFSILGTTYGGNGISNFGLPDLRGRSPMHVGNSHTLGEVGGNENITVLSTQMPTHTHPPNAVSSGGNAYGPAGNSWSADAGGLNFYGLPTSLVPMAPAAIAPAGGNSPHSNIQPSLVIIFVIALLGVFPSRN
jgi:microcystin-dependent protein